MDAKNLTTSIFKQFTNVNFKLKTNEKNNDLHANRNVSDYYFL